MKYAVYILTALLAAAGIIFLVADLTADMVTALQIYEYAWHIIYVNAFYMCNALALGVISLIQLKVSTPKLILLFSGSMFFISVNLLLGGMWQGSLLLLAALIPTVYELARYGQIVKGVPLRLESNSGILTAAGVIAGVFACVCIYVFVRSLLLYSALGTEVDPTCYSGIFNVVRIACLAVFCFLINRRTSVLYRFFFIGSSLLGLLLIPADVAMYAYLGLESLLISLIGYAFSLTLVLLVFIHAAKTRHNSILLHKPEAAVQQPLTPVV